MEMTTRGSMGVRAYWQDLFMVSSGSGVRFDLHDAIIPT
jgi:hypothetical protein